MSDLMNIGRAGLTAYSRSLDIVSQNIANAENPDYVRRRAGLADVSLSGRIPTYLGGSLVGGVEVSGITRSHDALLEAQLRFSGGERVRSETSVDWLSQVETGLANDGENVGTALNRFFATGEELASAPFENSLRIAFVHELDQSVSAFNRTALNLERTSNDLTSAAGYQADELNQALEHLGNINYDLTRTKANVDARAGLLDQRDAALAVISEKLDVEISFGDAGVANISFDGAQLVDGKNVQSLAISRNGDGSLGVSVAGAALRSPASGTLGGLSQAGVQIQTYRNDLDSQANNFMQAVNNWHAAGRTDSGNPGAPLLAMSGGAATLALTGNDPSALALASTDGRANGNLLNLPALRGAGGAENSWSNFLAGQANALAAAKSDSAATAALDQGARDRRDAISRVDIDREAADLIRLQQAYQASARVVQVARETIDSLLAIF